MYNTMALDWHEYRLSVPLFPTKYPSCFALSGSPPVHFCLVIGGGLACFCWSELLLFLSVLLYVHRLRVQELCESRGGRLGLLVLMSLMVSVDIKQH